MTVVESDKLIAAFMAIPEQQGMYEHPLTGEYVHPGDLPYSEYWDALMPVIHKLQTVTQDPEELDELRYSLWFHKIGTVYGYAVDAIIQYNKNQEQ